MQSTVAKVEAPLWERIHDQLSRLAKEQALGDYEHGLWLLRALRHAVHAHLGYASLSEYAERLFGYAPKQTGERLRVAEALEELPAMREALRQGQLCWSVVRELSRVATTKTEPEWLAVAEGKTARDVEAMVAGRRPGDGPDDPADPGERKRRLSFEVRPETLAAFREAVDVLRRQTGEHLSDEEALLLMARAACGGSADEGRSSYQVALMVCERCGQGFQQAAGELVAVGPEVVEMASCDAQQLGRLEGLEGLEGLDVSASPHVGPARRTTGGDDDGHAASGDRCNGEDSACSSDSPHAGAATEARDEQAGGGARCRVKGSGCDSDGPHATIPCRPPRAKQSIAPAVRRTVLRRQHGRCAVPGCRHRGSLDLHHLRYRTEGSSDPDDYLGLCPIHHRRAHDGLLLIEGSASAGLRFHHADGTEYGGDPSVSALRVREQALNTLVKLGFHGRQAKQALAALLPHVGSDVTLEHLVRRALEVLPGGGDEAPG